MKKTLFILSMVLAFASCSSDDDTQKEDVRRTEYYECRTNYHTQSSISLFNNGSLYYSASLYANQAEEGHKTVFSFESNFSKKGSVITLSESAKVVFWVKSGEYGATTETVQVDNLSDYMPTVFDVDSDDDILSRSNKSGIRIDGIKR